MAAAISLKQAALQTWDNLFPLSALGTLDTQLLAFIAAIEPTFSEQQPNDHPIENWISVLAGFVANMQGAAFDWSELRVAADYVYRMCWMAFQLNTQGLISNAQAAAMLAQYNSKF